MFIKNTSDFIDVILKTRDWSHGIEHSKEVLKNALYIWDNDGINLLDTNKINPLYFTNIPIKSLVGIVALLHDVCDHKYKNDYEEQQLNFLHGILSENDVIIVCNAIDNISFSKEQKGILSTSLTPIEQVIRNVVSDADKLEALGDIGIERCTTYKKEVNINQKQGLSDLQLKKKATSHMQNKLSKLYPDFFRTITGRLLACERHQIMKEWVENNNIS